MKSRLGMSFSAFAASSRNKMVLLVSAAIFTWLLVSALQSALYFSKMHYETRADYVYDLLADKKTARYPIKVSEGRFLWPRIEGAWDTAFLKVQVGSSVLSAFYEPGMSIQVENAKITERFERRAAGTRYFNLSALAGMKLRSGDAVSMTCDGMHLEQKNAELVVFSNRGLDKRSILIIAPHPDDAEIAAFGFYRDHKESVSIVTITAGDAGNNYFPEMASTEKSYRLKAKLRSIDSVTVPLIGGVNFENCVNLGYFDSRLKEMYLKNRENVESRYCGPLHVNENRINSERFLGAAADCQANWNNLTKDLAGILEKVRPTLIITPHPLLDGHDDHVYATVALIEALQRSTHRPAEIMLYLVHARSSLYPFGDNEDVLTLPSNGGHEIAPKRLYSYQLDDDCYNNKLAALETMHDIRFIGNAGGNSRGRMLNAASARLLTNRDNDHELYLHGIKKNELYFIYDTAAVIKMKDQIIKR